MDLAHRPIKLQKKHGSISGTLVGSEIEPQPTVVDNVETQQATGDKLSLNMKHGDLDFDDTFSHVKQAQQPFMPANVHNQTEALESLTREFIKRYGEY